MIGESIYIKHEQIAVQVCVCGGGGGGGMGVQMSILKTGCSHEVTYCTGHFDLKKAFYHSS